MSASALRFAISRGHGKATLLAGAHTFCEAFSYLLGLPVRLHVSADYERLLADVLERKMELAWMPPLLHARGADKGISVLALSERAGVVTYRSAIFVKKESAFQNLSDLRGARFAWTDKNSASGYVFPRLHLAANGLDPKKDFASEVFLGPSFAVCAAVAEGTADVGACHISEMVAQGPEQALAGVALHYQAASLRLRVLSITDSIPPDAIVLGPWVAESLRPKIASALYSMHGTADGQKALKEMLTAERLVPPSEDLPRVMAKLRGLI